MSCAAGAAGASPQGAAAALHSVDPPPAHPCFHCCHCALLHPRICRGLEWAGIELDEGANAATVKGKEGDVSTFDSRVKVRTRFGDGMEWFEQVGRAAAASFHLMPAHILPRAPAPCLFSIILSAGAGASHRRAAGDCGADAGGGCLGTGQPEQPPAGHARAAQDSQHGGLRLAARPWDWPIPEPPCLRRDWRGLTPQLLEGGGAPAGPLSAPMAGPTPAGKPSHPRCNCSVLQRGGCMTAQDSVQEGRTEEPGVRRPERCSPPQLPPSGPAGRADCRICCAAEPPPPLAAAAAARACATAAARADSSAGSSRGSEASSSKGAT